jgi:hypothetical protein
MNQQTLDDQVRAATKEVTLALSFWKTFRNEVARICKETRDFDDRPYIKFEESSPRIEEFGTETQELKMRCGCFEFAAMLEPLSSAIIYAFYLSGMENIFDNKKMCLGRGLIAISHADKDYFVHAIPSIQELILSENACKYDEFWQIGKEIARWACGSIVQRRLEKLKEAVSVTPA